MMLVLASLFAALSLGQAHDAPQRDLHLSLSRSWQGEVGALQRDFGVLLPVYAAPASFVPGEGERLWLGSFVPEVEGIAGLVASGVNMFTADTDELGPPDQGRGIYSFDVLAAQRRVVRDTDAKWALDIHTAFPTFDESLVVGEGTMNVVDGERIPAWSPWNMERIRWAGEKFGLVNRRFPNLDAVGIGVFGSYGDAGFFAGLARRDESQVRMWNEKLRVDPPSAGFWSGDPLAIESWRNRLVSLYGSVEGAYRAWGLAPDDAGRVPIPVDASYPISARLEYMNWYRAAIPQLAARLAEAGRLVFTESPVFIPVGPVNDSPYLGLDAFRLAQAVRPHATALKVTNVGYYNFAVNWAMSLGRIRAAARNNNLPVWTEAPVAGTPIDFQERLFSALSMGARGHTDWPNVITHNRQSVQELTPHWTFSAPRCDVAVLHPTSSHVLNPDQPVPPVTFRSLVELRDYADFDVLEESAVIAGALRNYRVAVVFEGTVWQTATLSAIRSWVDEGGTLLAYNFGRMANPAGNAAIYNDLFAFSAELDPAAPTDTWVGEVPSIYRVNLGAVGDTEYLLGQWGGASPQGRAAGNAAILRLPRPADSSVIISVFFGEAPQNVQMLDFLIDGEPVAGVALEGGLRQFRFIVDRRILRGNSMNLMIGGLDRNQTVTISSVVVSAPDAEGEPQSLVGSFEAPVEIEDVKRWMRPRGNGCVIFFPARREQWKQFISVVRHAIYRLSAIAEGAADARLLDDERDGVYITDLGRRVAVFNSNDYPVTRSLPTGPRMWSEVAIPAGQTVVVSAEPPSFTAILECEDADSDQAMELLEYAEASPGEGVTAVRVEPGNVLALQADVPRDGRYKVYARTLRNAVLAPVQFTVNGILSRPMSAGDGRMDVYFVGEFELQEGHVEIRMSSDVPFIADVVVITDKANLSGFAFARR